MFKKWLAPEGNTGSDGGNGQIQDPPPPAKPETPPAGNSAEKELNAALAEAQRWQTGYAGLQKTLSKKDGEIEKLTTKLKETEAGFTTLQQTHTQVQTEHQTSKEKIEEMELDLNTNKSALQRAKIIMAKFPQLAAWEADGDLPETPVDAKEEDVVRAFQSFSDKLAAATKSASNGAGGGPPPPAGSGGVSTSADEELKLAKDAASHGKMDEYNAHYNKYLELISKK